MLTAIAERDGLQLIHPDRVYVPGLLRHAAPFRRAITAVPRGEPTIRSPTAAYGQAARI